MSEQERNELVIGIVEGLTEITLDKYEEVKCMMRAVYVKDVHMTEFFHKAFDFVEKRRPLLLPMKEGASIG